jgi:hypothetical protein
MLQLRHRFFPAALALFLLIAMGCASSGGAEGAAPSGEPGVTQITIESFHGSSEDLRVFIEPDGGVGRIDHGAVPHGENRSFGHEGDPGQFQIVGEQPVGVVRSNRFTISRNTNITWNVEQNRIVTSRR